MINYNDEFQMEEEDFDDGEKLSTKGESKCKSFSNHEKNKENQFSASDFCLFNKTRQFNLEGAIHKSVRKPTIHY